MGSSTTHAITVWVGTASGTSAGYRSSTPGGTWTRTSGIDVGDAGSSAFPTLVDLDGDGAHDMLVGTSDGYVRAFRNTGSDAAPQWQRTTAWDVGADVGSNAAPAAIDVDGDGKTDVVVGNGSGDLLAFRNTGSKNAPAWTRRNAWDLPNAGSATHPTSADFDRDGHADLAVATTNGHLVMYMGVGGGSLAHVASWDATNLGSGAAPAAADINGDGKPDLLIVDSGARLVHGLRNIGSAFLSADTWVGSLDAGSGPGGIAVMVGNVSSEPNSTTTTTTATSSSSVPGGPTARVSAAPSSGVAPLPVTFDASHSSGANGSTLTYAWDFGDGTTVASAQSASMVDASAVITQAKKDYQAADHKRESGDKNGSIAGYTQSAMAFASLTGNQGTAPFSEKGFTTFAKISYLYLTRIDHDLGGVYTYNNIPGFASECARLQLGWQYFKDQFNVAALGGFPGLPGTDSFGGQAKLNDSTAKLHSKHCDTPPVKSMWPVPAGGTTTTPTPSVYAHTYAAPGHYTARVTVNDGHATATATVNIVVDGTTTTTSGGGGRGGGGGGNGSSDQPLEGYGTQTTGGNGGTVVHVTNTTDAAVRGAFQQAESISPARSIVRFDVQGPIGIEKPITVEANNLTVEGNGATLVAVDDGKNGWDNLSAILQIAGHDVIVRDLRLRDGGDNLRAQPVVHGSNATYNVVFDHISSTGANDDGISIGYGAHDVTVQYSFLAGNSRSIFLKYNGTHNISLHHNWIMKQQIRAPLANNVANLDIRNDIVEDWISNGIRLEGNTNANVINSLFGESQYAKSLGGSRTAGLNVIDDETQAWISGMAWQGVASANASARANVAGPFAAPAVTTWSVEQMEPIVRSNAGAMPRDDWDQLYVDANSGWSVGKHKPLRLR